MIDLVNDTLETRYLLCHTDGEVNHSLTLDKRGLEQVVRLITSAFKANGTPSKQRCEHNHIELLLVFLVKEQSDNCELFCET